MVLTVPNDRWDVSKILIDNGSQVEILFLSYFTKLTLEGEGEAFWFHFKHKTSPNPTNAISQTKNKNLSAHQSQLH
jgi:hypothetical protein